MKVWPSPERVCNASYEEPRNRKLCGEAIDDTHIAVRKTLLPVRGWCKMDSLCATMFKSSVKSWVLRHCCSSEHVLQTAPTLTSRAPSRPGRIAVWACYSKGSVVSQSFCQVWERKSQPRWVFHSAVGGRSSLFVPARIPSKLRTTTKTIASTSDTLDQIPNRSLGENSEWPCKFSQAA